MPAINTGRENTSAVKTKKAKKKYVPKPSPRPYSFQGKKNPTPAPPAPKQAAPTKSPVGDRNPQQGIRRAEKFKKSSPKYAASIRAAYKQQSVKDRNVSVAEAQAPNRRDRSVEQLAVLEAHRQRHKYDLQKLKEIGFLPRVRYAQYLKEYEKNQSEQDAASRMAAKALGLTSGGKTGEGKFSSGSTPLKGSTLGPILAQTPAGLAKRAGAIGVATYHDPIGVPVKTGKQAVLSVPAAVSGAVETVRHPIKTLTAATEDFDKRNKESFAGKVKRIRKEGAFADASDLALALSATGGATSAAARAALLRKFGERAAIRTSGGVVKVRPKAGVTRTIAGRVLDNARGARLARDLQRAEDASRSMDAVRYKAATANRRAGRTVQVVTRGVKSQQRRAVASERGKAVYRLRHDQKQRIDAVKKQVNRLNKNEKRAFWYASAIGIRHSTPVENKLALLSNLRDDIAQGRQSANIKEIKGTLKRSDMLPDLDRIIADVDSHFTPRLSEVVEGLRPEARKAAIEDPRLAASQANERRWAPVAAALRIKAGDVPEPALSAERPMGRGELFARLRDANREGEAMALPHRLEGQKPRITAHQVASGELPKLAPVGEETRAAYRARLTAEAKAQGLAKPLYFKSERYVGPTDFAARALGGGKNGAMREDFRYGGGNLKVGLQDTSPEQYMRGLARNIKAKHNWEHVANIVQDHVIEGLTSPKGTTVRDLKKRIAEAGIDESTVALWNPGVFRDAARSSETHDVDAAAEDMGGDTATAAEALKDAVIMPKRRITDDVLRSTGWQAIPVEVMREIERQTTPSRAAARVLDVAKGKASRAILLTGNVPWAGFQVASNIAVSAAATGGRVLNPANWVGAAKWWRELSPEERTRIGAEIGLDTAGADYAKTHLGASTNSDIVNTYRAIKAHPMWHTGVAKGHGPTISQLNPLELMAAFDRTQNNAARIATSFTKLKKETVREMGTNMSRVDKAQGKLAGILAKKDVRDQVRELAKNPKLLEENADAVHDWLGDYTSMTSFERQVVNRMVMFYPYLRYSLKLTFYTMPMKHPIMTSILAELGTLRADDLKQLLGGDRLYWNTGKVYFGEGGDVKEIDLRRANPALNALWDVAGSRNNGQLLGVLPPYAQWMIDQLVHRSTYADREWRTEGKAAEYGKKGEDYGSVARMLQPGTTRNRILAGSVARMFYPYRTAVDRSDKMQGVQGDDSLLWAPRPVEFKGRTYSSKLKAKAAKKQEAFEKENRPGLLPSMIPFVPQPSRDFAQAKDQKAIDQAEKHPPKRKHKKKYFGAGR